MNIRSINPIMPFSYFWKLCVVAFIFFLLMFIGADARYDDVTEKIKTTSSRVECPFTVDIDDRSVLYTANCPFGEVSGVLDTFDYFTEMPESLKCYSFEHTRDIFTGCDKITEQKSEET